MNSNQINEDTKTDLLNRIDSLDVLLGDIRESVQDAAGSLESLRSYARALEADEKPALFVGAKPKKTFAVGDLTKEGDGELLPIGSRIENYFAAYWEKTGEDEWLNESGGATWPTGDVNIAGREILRVGYDEPQRELELGDILFTREDFETVPKGHVVVEIVSPKNLHFRDGERATSFHFNLFVNDPSYFTKRVDEGRFYYLYGGKPVPPSDAEVRLLDAFDAWGANAIVQPVLFPHIALTLSPDGGVHYANGGGIEVAAFLDYTVRLVAVLDDGKVIPEKAEKPKAVFEPGDVVRINGGPFDGMKGHVLRVDLDLDNPYLVRAELTTGFGRYGADDLTFLRKNIFLYTVPRDRVKNRATGVTYTAGLSMRLSGVGAFEFLMPKRERKIGDVIDLKAARKLPVGSRVSAPEFGAIYWQKVPGQRWFPSHAPGGESPFVSNEMAFWPGITRRLLRYGNGDL